MTTPGAGPFVAELNFGTDIQVVADIIRQATGEIDGSLAQLFRSVQELGSSGGLTQLSDKAQAAVGSIRELQAAFARLKAEQGFGAGIGAALPVGSNIREGNNVLGDVIARGGRGIVLGSEALLPAGNEIARINLVTGKVVESFKTEADAVAYLRAQAAALSSELQAGTAVQDGVAAASELATRALGREALATATLADTRRRLAEGLISGQYTRLGGTGPIQTEEGLYGTSGKRLDPLQSVLAQERANTAVRKEAARAAEEAKSPLARGLDESLNAAKYVAAYAAVFDLVRVIHAGIEETKQFQEGLLSLDIALESIEQSGAVASGALAKIAAAGGASPGEGLQIAARGIQAFRAESAGSPQAAQDVATESTTTAIQAQVLAGGKLFEVQTQLIAAAREFNLGASGQERVLDAATNAYRHFGGSIGEVLQGLSQVAGLGEQAGFSVEQLASAIGLITTSTGLSGSAAAGDLKRILGGAGAPAFQKALTEAGVNTNQSTAKELEELAGKFDDLTQAEQNQVITTLGGRRSAEALIPLLADLGKGTVYTANAADAAGAAETEFNKRQETLAGTLRQVSGAAKVLITDLGQSGIGAGFGLALQAATPLLQTLDAMIQLFNKLPGPIRSGAFAVVELAFAIRGLQGLLGSQALGKLGGLLGFGGAARAAGAVETGGVGLVAGETAAAGVAGVAGEVGAVGAAATGLTTSFLGLTLAAGGLAGVLGGIVVASKTVGLSQAEHRGQDLLTFGGGNADDLKAQASKIATAEADIRDKSKGFTGTLADFFTGLLDPSKTDQAGRTIRQLDAMKKELNDEAAALEASTQVGQGAGVFGPDGPGSVQQLDEKVKNLTASGYTAAGILDLLTGSLDNLTGGAQAALVKGRPGSVAVTAGADAFASGLFGDVIPSSATNMTALRAAVTRINAGIFGGAEYIPKGDLSVQSGLEDPKFVARFQEPLSPENRRHIREDITRLVGDKKVLGPEDLAAIAQAVADQWGLTDPKVRDDLRKQILANLKRRAASDASGDRIQKITQDPGLINDYVTQAVAASQGALQEASARGADAGQLTQVAQKGLAAFQALAKDVQAAGLAPTQALVQQLAVARKAVFDAFQQHVQELLKVATDGLASNDTAGRQRLLVQAARLLNLANRTDASLLPASFNTLNQAEQLITIASANAARNVQAAAAAALEQARTDAAALIAVANELTRQAQARLDAAAGDPSAQEEADLRSQHSQRAADVLKNRARSLLHPPVPRITVPRLNDPSAQAGITALGSSGAQAAKAVTETAAQIAAAAAAANVFPGATVEQDAAKIRTAAADLGAAKHNTVAWYQALKTLRDAQYQYSVDVLAAGHVHRELAIDLTNPIATANEDVLAARRLYDNDLRRRAPRDVIERDRLAYQQALSKAQATAFSQNLDQVKTNRDLERITEAQYLAYLNSQHDHLQRIAHRTYQQQQELNQVDQLLKEAAKQAAGQFNIGDIKLPTIYEVRRAVQATALNQSVQQVQTNNIDITVNGNSQASVNAAVAKLTAVVGADVNRTGTRRSWP